MPRRRLDTEEGDFSDRQALDRHFAERYAELRRIAANLKRGESNVTINPTALVNEAWLRLSGAPELGTVPPAHFKATAARAMRRVLIDAARYRDAQKRAGGAGAIMVAFDDGLEVQAALTDDVLGLDAALDELARLEPRQARVVEGRYFGGLTIPELATLLDVSETTIERLADRQGVPQVQAAAVMQGREERWI
jgi:RNA polymerase sigma factor (TIGR02999 family)